MKLPVRPADIPQEDRDALRRHLLADNIRRGRVLAIVIIAFEAALAIVDVSASALKVDDRFHFSTYLFMYLFMMAANLAFFYLMRRTGYTEAVPGWRIARQEKLVTGYVTLMMCWGSVVSLMDQPLYGHVMTFMVNMITCSVVYSMTTRRMLLPYLCSVAILFAGLPFFQPSGDVLVGHYVNVTIFIAVSWIASRILYDRHITDFKSTHLLQKANEQLEQEIERNRRMNVLLADANLQLGKLSLLDELTGLANRRSFRHFIDRMFDSPTAPDTEFSVLMIDLDSFKEYNDTFGHNMGDEVLAAVAKELEAAVEHTTDIAARWGGEEFIYAAFGKGVPEIRAVAETIQCRVSSLAIAHSPDAEHRHVTVSIGSCTVQLNDKLDVSKCIDQADKAMYQAKAAGRNRIVVFGE